MELLVVPIFLVVGYLVFRSINAEHNQRMSYWAEAATELGGTFDAPEGSLAEPKLSYMTGEVEVYVGERTHHNGASASAFGGKTIYTTYAVGFPAIGPDMVIKKSSITRNIKKKLDRQDDVEVGEAAFDDMFVIDATDEDAAAVRTVLTPDRRAAVHDLFDRHGTARVTNMAIFTENLGTVKSSDELVETIRHLVSVAEVLTES